MMKSLVFLALTTMSSHQALSADTGASSYSFGCGHTAYLCGGLTKREQICTDHNTVFVKGTDDECRELMAAIKSSDQFNYRCSNGRLLRSYIAYGCSGGPGIKHNSIGDSYECQCKNKDCGLNTGCTSGTTNEPEASVPDIPTKDIAATSTLTEEEVRALFDVWNDALQTEDSAIVAKRYTASPMLLPTLSDVPRTDYDGLVDYFEDFLKKKPSGKILDGTVTVGDNWAMDGGIYEFFFAATNSTAKARYTYVYTPEADGEWRIAHHHSSQMPESITAKPQPITEEEVKALFSVWNDALATLDSDKVASLYAAEPVLLPTVSNIPRTNYSGLVDYFDAFLKKEPQGEILESYVYIGHNFARDAGIYEFTMRAENNTKVRARYTYVYVYEDGQWKISHHHSSVMPEG